MSNKSARPVKTHEEKLIDKAKSAIEKFWPPESDEKSQNAKSEQELSERETENPEKYNASKKQPSVDGDSKKGKEIKAKTNPVKKKKD